jgi:Fic family protein
LKVHFEAPASPQVPAEIELFVERYNVHRADDTLAPWLKSALAHLHLVTIHPWEDGNGRMARIVGDRALADASPAMARALALAASIEKSRGTYYDTLEKTQRSGNDVAEWLIFYADVTLAALSSLDRRIDRVVLRARFWLTHAALNFRPEQRKLLIRMLDDRDDNFELGISAGQYGRLGRVSKPTATRHLTELAEWGILERVGSARATRYRLRG